MATLPVRNAIQRIQTEVDAAPGTEILYDAGSSDDTIHSQFEEYQHLRKGDSHILLVPQPSLTDPNDPLRWSRLKKWATFSNALAYAFLGGVTGPIMAAWMVQGSEFFKVSLQTMTYANGATLVCQGVATTLWMPFAVKFGRRPVYLLSTLLMGCACIWLGLASSQKYTTFLLGRTFLGIWEAPIESIVPSTITDIFFLHDRGTMVSMYGLSVLGGNELGPLLSAFIIQYLGMNWAFYVVAMFIGLNLLAMIFFMPETKFIGTRPVIRARVANPEIVTDVQTEKSSVVHEEVHSYSSTEQQRHEARSWMQEVLRLPKADPDVNILHAFIRPFILVAYPTVLWSCCIYAMALSWNVVLGALTAQLFAPPPYLFSPSAQGLVFLSPLIGSLIGTWLCGPLADRVANMLTKRNDGVREPEMRLPVCIIAAILTFAGAAVTGVTLHYQTTWAGPIVGFGILSTGAQMGATLSMSYALDCHKELSVELMVTVASLKSLIAWIWTWVINDWVAKDGPLVVFFAIAGVNCAVYLTTVVLYMKGKSIRIWLAKKDFCKAVGL